MNSYCLIKNKDNKKDLNGFGSVSYNFLISQNFLSCEEYVNFLNCISIKAKNILSNNTKIYEIIENSRGIYSLHTHINPTDPISCISLRDLKVYCNWINTQDLRLLEEFPYNLANNTFDFNNAKFWIPTYNEWYKATYYDHNTEKYFCFPHSSDDISATQIHNNTSSPYGVINAGLKYFTIIDEYKDDNSYVIAGGSSNRNPIHSKSGSKFYISDNYYANYISARLCQKSETKKYTLKLYDTYGDGWGKNFIIINDANYKPLSDKITMEHGYGPISIDIEIDKVDRYFNIQYYNSDHLSYENHYELYNEAGDLLFASNMYEPPPKNTIISLST